MRDDKNNLIADLTFQFSLKIIDFTELLESRKKFNHKMKISAKEADETEYWLLLCKHSKSYPDPGELVSIIQSIQKVLSKIISSSKRKV